MYRFSHFRGAAIMGALSAIDIALWDIAGKHFDVPAYQLMGGAVRDKARVYYHVLGDTREKLVEGVAAAREEGFTAVGHLTPFLDEDRSIPYFKTHVDKMEDAIEAVRQYREAAGDNVDICIEIHRQLTPAEAIVLAKGIEQYHPMFYEDPTLPDNLDAMALIASKISIPIATGERIHTIHEFQMLLPAQRRPVRPPRRVYGGRTHALEEDRGARGGAVRRGHTAQSARTGEHRRLPAACRLHSKFRHPGIPARRTRAAKERDRQDAAAG